MFRSAVSPSFGQTPDRPGHRLVRDLDESQSDFIQRESLASTVRDIVGVDLFSENFESLDARISIERLILGLAEDLGDE